MSASWPGGVTTQEDMHRYANTLFGDCEIENLLTGTNFDGYPGCFLIRVKGACMSEDKYVLNLNFKYVLGWR